MNRLDTFGYFHLFERFGVQQKKKEGSIMPYFGRIGTEGGASWGPLSSFSLKWKLLPSELNEGEKCLLERGCSIGFIALKRLEDFSVLPACLVLIQDARDRFV